MAPHVRPMRHADFLTVVAIDAVSFPRPWGEIVLLHALRHRERSYVGCVAENDIGRVLGYAVYEITADQIRVANFAVGPRHRLQGVGRAIVGYLNGKLAKLPRESLIATVRESNMPGLKFARSVGFVATGLVRGHCRETGDDGIAMRFREPEAAFTL